MGVVCLLQISLFQKNRKMSTNVKGKLRHEKNLPTFHYTGWLIGILIMVY